MTTPSAPAPGRSVPLPLVGLNQPPSVRATCHSAGGGVGAGTDAPIVALVGAPNAGKSTLFNALTGSRVTMGNWPGTTVEVARGVWRTTPDAASCTCEVCTCEPREEKLEITLVDLPGAYSLEPHSPDEALTRELLVDAPADERPDVCVAVVDAAQLARSLYLLAQLREQPLRVVVALTMLDVARQRGIEIDTYALSEALGCPVVGNRSPAPAGPGEPGTGDPARTRPNRCRPRVRTRSTPATRWPSTMSGSSGWPTPSRPVPAPRGSPEPRSRIGSTAG